MSVFDAISHSFSTIAIGGFSPHEDGLAFYNSSLINGISGVFLFIAGCNFGLHFAVLSGRSLKVYWRDPEFKMYFFFQVALIAICSLTLWYNNVYGSF